MWKKLLLTSFIIFGMLSFSHAQDFGYTGGVQTFSAPSTGWYRLEVWGGQGQAFDNAGGKGGYASGYKYLTSGTKLYVVVGGGTGNTYNGGGGTWDEFVYCGRNCGLVYDHKLGGGATHIATTNRGVLSNYSSYRSEVLIVAGGGGGDGNNIGYAGSGGGTEGGDSRRGVEYTTEASVRGTQSGGNAFGYGSNSGGGGWYGGKNNAGGSGYTGGVTSYNGSSPSMSNGVREGNGYARITQMITYDSSASAVSGLVYNGQWQTGVTGSNVSWSGTTSAIDANTYTAKATPASGHGWPDGTTGTKTVTWSIARKKSASASAANKTYNGNDQTGVTGSNVTWSGTTTAKNAGGYTAYATPTSNYAWSDGTTGSKTITWSISKASVTIPSLSDTDKTYTGSSQSPTVNNRDSNKVGQSGTVAAINAGTYTVTWNLIDSNNYKWSDNTTANKSANWTIARAKTATASASNKNYNGTEQTGVSGSYVTWTGTTKAINPNSYTATATPDSNHAWSDGTTTAKSFTWSILQNWNRYTIDCVTDSAGKIVQPTDTIKSGESYTVKNLIFDIKAQDTSSYTFCVGKNLSKSVVYYNGEQSSIYYWENNSWVKK